MALATQCPHCQTTFRVAHDQLKLRAGLVRCGACKEIFNGVEHLLRPDDLPQPAASPNPDAAPVATAIKPPSAAAETETPSILAAVESSSPMPEAFENRNIDSTALVHVPTPASADASVNADNDAHDDPLQRMTLMDFTAFDESDNPAAKHGLENSTLIKAEDADKQLPVDVPADAPDELSQAIEELQRKPWRGTKNQSAQEDEYDSDSDESAEPEFVKRARRQQRIGRASRMIVRFGSVFLLLVLLAQAAYTFRNQIAARLPQTSPALAAGCALISCRMGLPAQIDAVSLESSELQALPSSQNTFVLITLLRNRGATAQAWPNIELTLNDANEKPIAKRVFTPRDYLPATQDLAKGFAGNSEQSIKLFFELSQLKASGYRVYLFYP
jgi:predicted Zn finger-like uncharacterized protein